MTVMISPKDSGPIDTHDKGYCRNCENTVRISGKRIMRDIRKSDRGKNGYYLNVCPYCKDSMSNCDTVKCGHCKAYFDLLEASDTSPRKTTLCPKCEGEITKDTATVLD